MGGAGLIPLTAIWAYADRYDCPTWFADVIQAADLEQAARRRAEGAGKADDDGCR